MRIPKKLIVLGLLAFMCAFTALAVTHAHYMAPSLPAYHICTSAQC